MQLSKDIYEQIGRGEAVPEDSSMACGFGVVTGSGASEDLRNLILFDSMWSN